MYLGDLEMCGYQEKFQIWKSLWNGDDENSILKQIQEMMWRAAIFEVLKNIHNNSLSQNDNKEIPNWIFWDYIFSSHFEIQANAIMRLLDRDARKKRDVFSLYCLILDIKENCKYLTRNNILESLNLPYEYKNGLTNPGQDTYETGLCMTSYSRHKKIDNLTNITDENDRNPSDTISSDIIIWIEKQLDIVEIQDIKMYRHKYVAHAATNESRCGNDLEDMEISLGKISKANEIICKVANFIAENILGCSQMTFLAANISDVIENFDKPVISGDGLSLISDKFDEYRRQAEQWCNWNWSSEFNKSDS